MVVVLSMAIFRYRVTCVHFCNLRDAMAALEEDKESRFFLDGRVCG